MQTNVLNTPRVSVVLSVHDQPDHVRLTIDSVMSQTGIDLEFLIVDDGATDAVKKVLDDYSSDSQITVLEQSRQGLTKALIRACSAAQNPLVARIDAGDRMRNDRLLTQAKLLEENESVVLVTSWVDTVTDEGYPLYNFKPTQDSLESGARACSADQIITPVHSSVMFRKSTYEKVGGYRPEFYFAQDCDLWSRIIRYGEFRVIGEPLTKCVFSVTGISGQYTDCQRKLKGLVAEANKLTANGLVDTHILAKAKKIRPNLSVNHQHTLRANFPALYFIAKCLEKNKSRHAKEYWTKAVRAKPWSLVTWVYLLRNLFYRRV